MLCDLCGERAAKFTMKTEGSEILVCDRCRGSDAKLLAPQFNPRINKKTIQDKELVTNFGELINKARKENELGRGGLAYKLGIKESVLARIESGKLEPDESLRKKLENELKIELTEFPEFKPSAPKPTKKKTLGDIVELR